MSVTQRRTPKTAKTIIIRPQDGPQERGLASPADIVIQGGAAGGGKTFGLLLEALRHMSTRGFGAVIFRRTYPQITNEGGLWDESGELYRHVGAVPKASTLEWAFPSGARLKFAHLQHEDDRHNWKGAQIPLIGFDQLEEFTEAQFWFLLGRNRSLCGVRPYLRATCNPVPEDDEVGGWLHRLLSWWIDPVTGYAIEERSGVIRWMLRVGDDLLWGGTREEVAEKALGKGVAPEDIQPKSFTFIPSTLDDNPALLKADPGYRANLLALPLVERERLLRGNWKIRPTAGKVFNRAWLQSRIVDSAPTEANRLRYWDKAGTEGAGDYSAGVRIAHAAGVWYVEHVVRGRWSSHKRNEIMRVVAESDGVEVPIVVEQEPGSGGKESAEISVRSLAGFAVRAEPVTGDKVTRAGPLAAQAEAGNVRLVRGPWNEDFLAELHNFPEGGHDDQVDAASGAFTKLALRPAPLVIVGGGGATMTEEQRQQREAERKREAELVVQRAVASHGAYFPQDLR